MAKINLKKTRWYKYFYEIEREFELTAQQTKIFGYIYNHCQSMTDNGYIGYSDEHMAEKLNMTYERFRKELYVLRKKELIIIKNPGKRTKKTGQSRMIYINTAIFLEEDQVSLTDIELDNVKRENENIKKENERLREELDKLSAELRERKCGYANGFTAKIASSGVIPSNMIEEMHRILAPVYRALANEYTYEEIKKHIDYVVVQIKKKEEVKKPITYFLRAAEHFKSDKIRKKEIDKSFNSLPEGIDLSKLEKEQEFYHQEVLELDIDDDDPFA